MNKIFLSVTLPLVAVKNKVRGGIYSKVGGFFIVGWVVILHFGKRGR